MTVFDYIVKKTIVVNIKGAKEPVVHIMYYSNTCIYDIPISIKVQYFTLKE